MAFTVTGSGFASVQAFGLADVVAVQTAYATLAKLRGAMSAPIFVAAFDDDNDGVVTDPDANVNLVLRRAHAEVLSYLPNLYATLPTESDFPLLLESAELDFAFALALDRRPELARTFTGETAQSRWDRAQKKMDRLQKSIQRLTENVTPATPPNVGGSVLSGNSDSPDPVKIFVDDMGDF